MLHAQALVGLIFMQMGATGFGGGGPVPIGALLGSHFKAPVVRWAPEPRHFAAPAGITFSNNKPSDFPFLIIIPDDGTAPSGWQEAKASLEFIRIVIPKKLIKWYCALTIGMPIRNSTYGKISLASAAMMSAAVTNRVGQGMDYTLPQGIFCHRFVSGVQAAFPITYPGLGERVNR